MSSCMWDFYFETWAVHIGEPVNQLEGMEEGIGVLHLVILLFWGKFIVV